MNWERGSTEASSARGSEKERVIGVLSSLRSEVFVIESKSKEKTILSFDFLLSVSKDYKMDALRKQASKLREQVAKQQQVNNDSVYLSNLPFFFTLRSSQFWSLTS